MSWRSQATQKKVCLSVSLLQSQQPNWLQYSLYLIDCSATTYAKAWYLRFPRVQSNRMNLGKNLVTPTSSLGINNASTPVPKSRLGGRFMWAICRLLSSHLCPSPSNVPSSSPHLLHPQPKVLKSIIRETWLPIQAFWSSGEHLSPAERLLICWRHRSSN